MHNIEASNWSLVLSCFIGNLFFLNSVFKHSYQLVLVVIDFIYLFGGAKIGIC